MANVVIQDEENAEELTAKELGKAEGATEVHVEHAADQAERAELAAELAAASVDATMSAAGAAENNALDAADAAFDARAAHQATLDALNAQSLALQSLAEELRASRETSAPAPVVEKPKAQTIDRPPAPKKKASWYFGK